MKRFLSALSIVALFGFTAWKLMPSIADPSAPYEAVSASFQNDALSMEGLVFAPSLDSCFGVEMKRGDDRAFDMDAVNQCERELPAVYVLIKFLDPQGRRIGVASWQAHYVAAGERLHKRLPTPAGVNGYTAIAVRKITDDPADALR